MTTTPSFVYLIVVRYVLPLSRYVGEHHIPIVERTLAWTIITLFGIRYVIDYLRLWWRLRNLRSRPNDWWSHGIPLCSLAHTRKELDVSIDERWDNLLKAILQARQAQPVEEPPPNDDDGDKKNNYQSKNNSKNSPMSFQSLTALFDDDWVRIVQSSLEVRREVSYLMHNLARASPTVLDYYGLHPDAGATDMNMEDDTVDDELDDHDLDDDVGPDRPAATTIRTTVDVDDDDPDHGRSSLLLMRRDLRRRLFRILVPKFQQLWPRFMEFPEWVVRMELPDDEGYPPLTDAAADTDDNDDDDDESMANPLQNGNTTSSIKDENSSNQNTQDNRTHRQFTISLVVPVYRERIEDVQRTLDRALLYCLGDPQRIQVIIVHVPSEEDMGVEEKKEDQDGNEFDVGHVTTADDNRTVNITSSGISHQHHRLGLELQRLGNVRNTNETTIQSTEERGARRRSWGDLHVVTDGESDSSDGGGGGGRGRALNVGMASALNRCWTPIITFLHADTLVPPGWDVQITDALLLPKKSERDGASTSLNKTTRSKNHRGGETFFPQACAFTMGIDGVTSDPPPRRWHLASSSLQTSSTAATSEYGTNPPGMVGVERLGVLRCHCGLPYGDSVLSFRTATLEYIGGFPSQPFMEDYELMDWFRVRSFLLSGRSTSSSSTAAYPHEGVVLFDDQIRCSPRRWRAYGVAYTTLVNAVCIYRYRTLGVPAEDLFDFYYHKPQSDNGNGTSQQLRSSTKTKAS